MPSRIPDEHGLELLRKLCEECNECISATTFQKHYAKPSPAWFYIKFGSWPNALKAAGYDPRPAIQQKRVLKKEEILAHLKKCFEEDPLLLIAKNYRLSKKDPSMDAIVSKFGSWRNVLLALNFDVNTISRPSMKRLVRQQINLTDHF